MRFLIDAQLPPALARILREKGYKAEHVENVGLRHAKDTEVWMYAIENEAALLTKDEDFVEQFRRKPRGPVIIWLRIGNASTENLVRWLMPSFENIVARMQAGDRLIELR